ncbi:hypothetical protein BDQ12DRAFT_688422 [Crucibulum laeve]|uniref:PH domain-containing protein n=1 Tax=Crucibulum laeve TaxID=68775 RepID=A0A5C3LPZ7_9AGAR|nr:hypothetical protein BDQ12DRAFT_688422 [Crucibulum laeve]
MAETHSLTRAPSRSSRAGSTLSRNQSLIKKHIEQQSELKPSDVLIERFVAWKAIVKQLIAYFEGIADIENNTARELAKLAGVIQVPFRSGNQFLGEGGLQDVYYSLRDKTRIIADQHADLGRTIDSSIVQHLQKLRTEIKAHIKNVQNDTGKLASGVAKERELSTRLIGELANDISSFKNTPMSVQSKTDPYVANQAVARQLQKQVLEENLLQKSIIMMQQNSAHFEEGIVRAIQSAWQTYDEWQARAASSSQDTMRGLATMMAGLEPDREWITFAARSDHLLDPDTPLRDPEAINYPLKDDPSVIPVHMGHLERKKRFTRTYKESYFVLTPAGFLHEYPNSDPATATGTSPSFSLFLPMCTLGPPSAPNAKSHKFHIEGRKDGMGTTKSGSFRGILGGERSQLAWSFRARSRDEMMEWWNDIRMLCARYLVASEQMERSGPVEAAVRAVGYVSGEDEGEESEEWDAEEDEGSSVEEEAAEVYEDVEDGQAPPIYSHTHDAKPHYPVEIGPNGYAVEKKGIPGQYNNRSDGNVGHDHSVPINEQGPEGAGAPIARRPSKRQQEKAPEGRPPHITPQMTGNADDGEAVMDPEFANAGSGGAAARGNSSRNGSIVGSVNGTSSKMENGVEVEGEPAKPVVPTATGDAPGPAPLESRFQEAL